GVFAAHGVTRTTTTGRTSTLTGRLSCASNSNMSHEYPRVAYFCMEFGLSERLTIYSGGLGVLAGDFLRSARALGVPLVGVGIAWAEGYARQVIGADGIVHDEPTPLDRSLLHREPHTVHVSIGGRE